MAKESTRSVQNDVRWDLSFLYSGVDDPQLDADVESLIERMRAFCETYRGKLHEKLGDAIAENAELSMLEMKIGYYLFLAQSLAVADTKIKAKLAEVERALSYADGEYLTFFKLELVALDEKAIDTQKETHPVVKKHLPWIEHERVFRPHVLIEPVESALTKREPFGPDAWSEFFDELEADLRFRWRKEEKPLKKMLHILGESKDAAKRAKVLRIINKGFRGPFAKYAAQTLYMVTGGAAVEGQERKYRNPMEKRNKENRVPDEVVDALHHAVTEHAAPLAQRFYRLKAAHLGLPRLRWSDRNAPMPFTDTTVVPFKDAMDTVLKAYESFSPTLADILRDFLAKKRIDVPALPEKRGSAYSASLVLPGNIPVSFTFLNYLGSNRDVMVLAHELGHGVHGMLAGEAQGPLMFQAPIAYCETASVFGEMTTFRFLKQRLESSGDEKSLLALLMGKLDDMINTVVRQIGFSNFERRLHGMDASYSAWNEPKKLGVEEISSIWLETLEEMYGKDGDVFTYENADLQWSYVGHFHRPFYVYGYAFGELLTHSLIAEQSRHGERFEPLYLELLRTGSTKNVIELVEPFGPNPTNESFWNNGIEKSIGAMLKEAEELSQHMSIVP